MVVVVYFYFATIPSYTIPNMSSPEQSEASSPRGITHGERVLRGLGTQHETNFPFWEPGEPANERLCQGLCGFSGKMNTQSNNIQVVIGK